MTIKQSEEAADNNGEGGSGASVAETTGVTSTQADKFLESWSLSIATVTLMARRENTVYRVDAVDGKSYALRVRRAGYRSDAEINSELDWMTMLAKEGLRVPVPVAATDGTRVVCIGKYRADLVTWLNGVPMGRSGEALNLVDPITTFRTLGRTAAKLHLLSDQWTLPAGFQRPCWDNDALLGEAPLWGRFWDCAGLTASDKAMFGQFRDAARAELTELHASLDTGLIHADLVRENILLQPTEQESADHSALALIDFDDGVFGYRLFELATALGKNVDDHRYVLLRKALIDGYCELRPIDTSHLDLFMAIRAATYVGWSAERKAEPGGEARAERCFRAARKAITQWLHPDRHGWFY